MSRKRSRTKKAQPITEESLRKFKVHDPQNHRCVCFRCLRTPGTYARLRYEKIKARVDKKFQPLVDAIRASQQFTAKDFKAFFPYNR